jgi:hypothetical protein
MSACAHAPEFCADPVCRERKICLYSLNYPEAPSPPPVAVMWETAPYGPDIKLSFAVLCF